MALTKVSGGILDPGINVAGIVTATGFDGPFIGGTGDNITAGIITATGLDLNGNADISGSLTVGSGGLDLNGSGDISGDLVIHGNLTANGDFTTLNTTLREVEILRVDANSSEPAGIITQTGAGDLLRLYDGTSQVVTVDDEGNVGLGSAIPAAPLDVSGRAQIGGTAQITGTPYSYFYGRGNGGDGVSIYAGEPSLELVGTNGGSHAASLLFRTAANDGIGFNYNPGGNTLELKSFDATGNNFQIHGSGSNVSNLKNILKAVSGGAVELYHNNNRKIFTTSTGVQISCDPDGDGLKFEGTTRRIDLVANTNRGGAVNTILELDAHWNNTSVAFIALATGDDTTNKDDGRIRFFTKPSGGTIAERVRIETDGKVNLYNDLNVSGISTFSNNVHLLDNDELRIGGSAGTFDGMKLYHNASNSIIEDTGTGALILDGSKIRLRLSGSTQLETDTNGIIATGTAHRFQSGTSGDCELIIEADTDNNNELDNPRILFRQDGGNDWSAIGTNDNVLEISNSVGSGGILFKTGGTNGYTNATGRWKIDTNGHLLPNTAGAVNIGSATAEIGDVFLADDKRLKLGSDQDMLIFHNNTHGYVANRKNNLYLEAVNYVMITSADTNGSNQQTSARFLRGGASDLYHSNTLKFSTSSTGVTVTGEVAATQDYPNFRPALNFNFAAEKKLEPRVTYERTGPASFTDEFGKVVLVGDNAPRFDHDPDTKESLGLLIEPKKTNQWLYSEDLVTYLTGSNLQQATLANTTATTDPTGGTNAVKMTATPTGGAHSIWKNFTSGSNGDAHTFSVWVKAAGADYARIYVDTVGGNINGPGVTFSTGNVWNVSATGNATQVTTSAVKYPNGWWRLSTTGYYSNRNDYYFHIDIEAGEGDVNFTGNGSDGIYVWGAQVESSTQTNVTSYIPTYGAAVTRGDDIVKLDGEDFTDFYNQEEGTLVSEFKIFDRIQSSAAIANINALSSSSYADSIMFMEVGHVNGYFGRVYKNSNGINLDGSSDQSSIVQNGNQTNKVSFGWSAPSINQGLAAYLNGTLQEESTDESRTPTNMTELRIGTGWQQNSSENQTWAIHAHVKKLMYYPKRLSNNQLATLTS